MAYDPREYDERGDVIKGYLTPEESEDLGFEWRGRPGEPDDLRDPYHYQTPDEAESIGIDWATQPTIRKGTSPHPEMTDLYNRMARENRLEELRGYGYDAYEPWTPGDERSDGSRYLSIDEIIQDILRQSMSR